MRRHRGLAGLVLAGACACGPQVMTAGDTETDGSGSDGSTTMPPPFDPTNDPPPPMTTGPDDGGVTTDRPHDTGPLDTSGGDESESCCEPHAMPGCDEPTVSDCVCSMDAICCAFEWSESCVTLALDVCDATCESTDSGDTGAVVCDELVQIELFADDAIVSGDWVQQTSMLGEGQILVIPQGQTDGAVRWQPQIPCADTWRIWVRFFQNGAADSYFATVDDEPRPPAIFEGDCGNGGDGWGWALLNWRDPGDPPCTYLEDPWAPAWTAGPHAVEFSYRESIAIARIVVTNDPAYVP